MNFKSYLVMALGATMLVTSCKKGDTGPAGPMGPQGNTGGTGATGAPGTNGSNGKDGKDAQVIYSNWMPLNFVANEHPADESNETRPYTNIQVIDAPQLTSEFIDHGTVLTYIKNSEGFVRSVNTGGYIRGVTSDGEGFEYGCDISFTVGKIILLLNWGNVDEINDSGTTVRYILIPGITAAATGRFTSGPAAGFTKVELKKMSYEQVMKLLKK
jgi:hypothetical protein